ncbi:MAG: phosphotransferase [Planctomycetota bacterium]
MQAPARHSPNPIEFVRAIWGLAGTCTPLPGDVDENWRLDTATGSFALKIASKESSLARLAAEARVQATLHEEGWPVPGPCAVPAGRGHGRYVAPAEHRPTGGWARLSTWVPGTPWSETPEPGERFGRVLGRFLARLDRELDAFEEPELEATHAWDLLSADAALESLEAIHDAARRARVERWLAAFVEHELPSLRARRLHLVHNDANDHNVLVEDGAIGGLLDFGDMLSTVRVAEPAIAAAYLAQRSREPVGDARALLAAYEEEYPLHPEERVTFVACLRARLMQTVITAAARAAQRDDAYASVHAAPAWDVLDRWETSGWERLAEELRAR